MKKQKINIVILSLFIIAGCASNPSKVCLNYQPSIKLVNIPNDIRKKIGVFSFVDNREEIPPNAYGTIVKLITAELPIAYYSHIKTETIISNYVTDAFKAELKNLGFQIVDSGIYLKAISPREVQKQLEGLELRGVDKIIVGRIRFFRWTEAGFAGLLFQPGMPKPRLNVEIQVEIIDPRNMKIVWAGSGWALEKSNENFPRNPEREIKIKIGLNKALNKIIGDKRFLDALLQ